MHGSNSGDPSFPSDPRIGQRVRLGWITFEWDGESWKRVRPPGRRPPGKEEEDWRVLRRAPPIGHARWPGRYDLRLYTGDTRRWRFQLWLDRDKTVPFPLEWMTAKAEIRNRPGGTTNVPLGLEVELPNIIHAVLTAEQSSFVPFPIGWWDLQLQFPVPEAQVPSYGDIYTILAGEVHVEADITDSWKPREPLRVIH